MKGASPIRRLFSSLPAGTRAIAVGLAVLGLSSYGFLLIAGRALGPAPYARLSVLWALVFIVGPGVFLPLEQEIARAISARRVHSIGSLPIVRRSTLLGLIMTLVLGVISLIAGRPLAERAFGGDTLLLWGLIISLGGFFLEHLARGILAGQGRFGTYAAILGAEGLVRLIAAGVLATAGISSPGPYGLVLGVAPALATVAFVLAPRNPLHEGPEARWKELTTNFRYLLLGSLLAQVLVNIPAVAVGLLAEATEQAAAGRFMAALVLARVPVFAFNAVQSALLPRLSGLASSNEFEEMNRILSRLAAAITVVGVPVILGAIAAGPDAIALLFGSQFRIGGIDLGFLAAASLAYVAALAFAQGLIALGAYRGMVMAWSAGLLTFIVLAAALDQLLLRVELGFLSGTVVCLISMKIAFGKKLQQPPSPLAGEWPTHPIHPA